VSVATAPAPAPVARPAAAGGDKRLDIQALRALAVGAVLVYHLWPRLLPGGFTGVDVFFVISGFLISSHLLTRPPRSWRDLVAFWSRRVRRLLPDHGPGARRTDRGRPPGGGLNRRTRPRV